MNNHQAARSGAIALLAFVAGFALRGTGARAAAAPLTPQLIDVNAIVPADLAITPASTFLRSKTYVTTDGATVAVQIGTVPKHFHADANEIQYVVDGSGTEWLGGSQRELHPGDMLVIPKGTAHGGTVETSGHLKILAIKSPVQDPADYHVLAQ